MRILRSSPFAPNARKAPRSERGSARIVIVDGLLSRASKRHARANVAENFARLGGDESCARDRVDGARAERSRVNTRANCRSTDEKAGASQR